MKQLRYVVRKESFGGLMYDRLEDAYISIDSIFLDVLKRLKLGEKIDDVLNQKQKTLLIKEKLLVENSLAYEIVENEHKKGVLSAPVRIHYCYTYECNLNCVHCFTKKQRKDGEELSFNEKIDMLDQLQALGIAEILVGGGEPFIKDDFLKFIDECNRRNINIKVFTNGLLLTDELIHDLSKYKIKYLSISVDGANEEDYRKVRKIAGLSEIIECIKKIKRECTFDVAISITVNNQNKNNVREYLEIARKAGVDRIKIRPTKPSGNVLENPDIYVEPGEYIEFIKKIQALWNAEYKEMFKLDFSWGDTRIKYNELTNEMVVINNPFPYEGYGCFAGKGSMVIRANGQVSPCGFLPENMQVKKENSIKYSSIKELWDNANNFEFLRNLKGNDECKRCQYYAVCRGGCIARILYANKKINEVDPWCLKKYFPAKM